MHLEGDTVEKCRVSWGREKVKIWEATLLKSLEVVVLVLLGQQSSVAGSMLAICVVEKERPELGRRRKLRCSFPIS